MRHFAEVPPADRARIHVAGVGGGGCNAVQHLIDSGLRGVRFLCVNTDAEALKRSTAACTIQIGARQTKGLGAEGNPSIGREAALESLDAIREALSGADIVVVTAGMGGGTGTGAAPVIAQAAGEMGVITVGVVTSPFAFEGAKRRASAEAGIIALREHVDGLVVISNDSLLELAPKSAQLSEILAKAGEVLYSAVKGIADMIAARGTVTITRAEAQAVLAGLAGQLDQQP